MSDLKETKPDVNQLLTCKLEFEAHDEDTPDLLSCVEKPSAESKQRTRVKRSLVLDSSDDEEFTKKILSGENGSLLTIKTEDSPSIEQTSGVNPSLVLDSSDDEEFTEELLSRASGELSSKTKDSSSIGQISVVNPSLILDSSDDEELSEELLSSASGEGSRPAVAAYKRAKITIQCYICKKEFFTQRDMLMHRATHGSKTCNVCGKSFVNMVLLNKHSLVHFDKDGKNSFVCKACDCAFPHKQDFISHMLFFKHDENRIFKCDDCRGFFTNESDLKAHLVTHESKHKALHCDECGENFQRRLDLKNHMVNHIGERNHKCEDCNLSFKSKFVLAKHQEVIHSSKLVCNICNLSFSKKDQKNFDFHLKLHSK